MIDKFIKDYNQLFADELNKSKVVQSYIGPIKPNDMHKLHSVIQFTWLHTLYSYFPTVLNFGKYFYIFTKHQRILDKYEISNYHKMTKERKARAKLNSNQSSGRSVKILKHLNK